LTAALSYANPQLNRGPRHGPGIVSCGLGLVAGLLLGYAAYRLFATHSPIALGVCVIASAPTVLGVVLAVTGLVWRSRSRCAAVGLAVNLLVAAGLAVVAFVTMQGLD
jgi:hypothetical protein